MCLVAQGPNSLLVCRWCVDAVHWPQFQESERSNRVLLATAIAAFDSLESGAKDESIRQTMVWLLSEGAT